MAPLANVDELIAALEKATSSTAAANACRYVLHGPLPAGYVDVWLEFQRLVPGPPPFQGPVCAEAYLKLRYVAGSLSVIYTPWQEDMLAELREELESGVAAWRRCLGV